MPSSSPVLLISQLGARACLRRKSLWMGRSLLTLLGRARVLLLLGLLVLLRVALLLLPLPLQSHPVHVNQHADSHVGNHPLGGLAPQGAGYRQPALQAEA